MNPARASQTRSPLLIDQIETREEGPRCPAARYSPDAEKERLVTADFVRKKRTCAFFAGLNKDIMHPLAVATSPV